MRLRLIESVIVEKSSVASACRALGIKLTTGCLIIRNYKKERRIFQKPGSIGPETLPGWEQKTSKPSKRKNTRAERYMTRNQTR